ncbi:MULTISPECIES: NADH-quinone oxidoreductase subunit C [Streptomyces]|uniref:NADH-quinone oxidoreductase subunit C n=1 Tax=Streptomyces TaxID=1883 RepID=UPI0022766E9C|nr:MULTISPECIES: NADH-quinone oxidoreductase subunit C [unclassified Streptomyces]MCY1653109.1 NADH-quinone oxidoreductase subunit C [Streptomyces sp. SL203]MCY1679661.1 NADH-quinone oxidoreductase subunit C [Streptomyces sp. SL294]
MTASETYDRLPDAVTDVFGADATAAHAYDLLTVDVPAASWTEALETARDVLGCTYFDWLSAVDEPGTGFRVCAHVAALGDGTVRRLLLRTTVPHDAAVLPTAVGVYAGAAWHERETHEMFGIGFEDHPHLVPLLLPDTFEGHPLRKDFVLAARVAKAWPGAKEPGESEHGGPKRRTMLPPGVPDPNEWGPLKGQLPPAPARPARRARAAGDRPVRRARSVTEGSAAQRPDAPETPQAAPPRRTRSASQGSASQATGPAPVSPAATPSPGGSEAAAPDSGTTDAGASRGGDTGRAKRAAGSADAPWHDAQPAFADAPKDPGPKRPAAEGPAAEGPAAEGPAQERPVPKRPVPAEAERAATPEPESEQSSVSEQPPGSEAEQPSASGADSEARPAADPDPADPDPAVDPDSGSGSDSGSDSASRADRSPGPDRSSGPDRSPGPDRPDRPAGGDTA